MNKTNLDILDDEARSPAHPSFPIVTHDTGDIVKNADQGVSKRDWFAAHADSLLNMRTAFALMDNVPVPSDALAAAKWWALAEAKHRYLKADAMMEVRK
jgi:hypothetical protein